MLEKKRAYNCDTKTEHESQLVILKKNDSEEYAGLTGILCDKKVPIRLKMLIYITTGVFGQQ